jgi:hypothetical protein
MTQFTSSAMPNVANRRAPMDVTAALVALLRTGVSLDRVFLKACGEYRNYEGEIRSQAPEPGAPLDEDTEIRLEVGCPSAVDLMPYQFFYGFGSSTAAGSAWEEDARHVMAPFDGAVVRSLGAIQYQLLKMTFGHFDRRQVEQFIGIFGIGLPPVELTPWEWSLLATLMPTYNEWAGNAEGLAAVLERFFGFEFRVVENVAREYPIPERHRYRLGQPGAALGAGTLVGRSFTDADTACVVQISGLLPAETAGLLPGKPTRAKLDWFLKMALPAEVHAEIRLIPLRSGFILGRSEQPALLGMSTRA